MAFLNMNKTFNTHFPKYSAQARKQSWLWKKNYFILESSWIFSASVGDKPDNFLTILSSGDVFCVIALVDSVSSEVPGGVS